MRAAITAGICLFMLIGSGYALEPVRSGTPTPDLLLKYRRGEAHLPIPAARQAPAPSPRTGAALQSPPRQAGPATRDTSPQALPAASTGRKILPPVLEELDARHRYEPNGQTPVATSKPVATAPSSPKKATPKVRAKAVYCLDCSANKVVLSENSQQPLPIASITKLLTAMTVIDDMKLDHVIETPHDILQTPRHRVGIRPGDKFSVEDLLHGMLIESGNDCAEALAAGYPRGGKAGFMAAMRRKASQVGVPSAQVYTPSGLDTMLTMGRSGSRELAVRKPNTASAKEVALIATQAFQYPLIRKIATMKTHTMRTVSTPSRTYNLATNDKLLSRNLPVAGAKTGYTDMAGKCIVALFRDQAREHMVVVLNTRDNFKAAEKIYRWAQGTF